MGTGIHILVVDDEESLRGFIAQILIEDGHDVSEATSGELALEAFRKDQHPLVITDIRMGGLSGIQLLREIKEMRPETQVIIITSHASLDTALTALRAGAYDYLIKPFEDLELISAVVNRAVEKINLISENRLLIDKLKNSNIELELVNRLFQELAVRDGLTGLYNHRYFQEFLATELARSQRYGRVFSLVMLDVDFFKHYNDTQGHLEGDRLLCALAQLLKECVRKSDVVARYGGEEFIAVLPETTREGALIFAEGLRQRIAEYAFPHRETQPLGSVTVSLGVSTYPQDGTDGPTLINCADQALYRAKRQGRNVVC